MFGHDDCVRGAQASSQLAGEVAKVTDFLDTSRDQRRWAEEGARALQTQLRAAHKRMVEAKRGYETRCREEIQVSLAASQLRSHTANLCVQANHQYHQEVARCGVADRAAQRHSKVQSFLTLRHHLLSMNFESSQSVSLLEAAEQGYRAAVAGVEEARASWQEDTETALETFQEIAVARQPALQQQDNMK